MSHYYQAPAHQHQHSAWDSRNQHHAPAAFASQPPQTLKYKPSLTATELETEFEDDLSDSDEDYYHGRRSEDSTSKRSETTISSFDEVRTPNANSIGFNFHQLPVQDGLRRGSKAMEGPSGPSLFRMSQESSANMDIYLSMSPPGSPMALRHPSDAPLKHPQQHAIPQAHAQPQAQPDLVFADAPRTSVPLRTWTPWQVADWMHSLAFERSMIDQFFVNDISGVTLIDLQYDDLKELGISSFGQRHRLWTEIRTLKEQNLASNFPPTPGQEMPWQTPEPSPPLPQAETRREPTPPQKCQTPEHASEEDEMEKRSTRRAMRRAIRSDDIISPAESASIVAIEQLLPKPHRCSKGENCPKWKKQQRKLAKIATEFPVEYSQIVEGKQSPSLESGLNQPNSIVASSDLLGPAAPKVKLEEESLKSLQSRDPQDNVRQFLSFQHVASPKLAPDTPGYEMFPPLSPPEAQTPHANLKALPKLTIPSSPEETIRSPAGDQTARPLRRSTTPLTAFYTNRAPVHDIYRIGSPASEMDVPVTAMPADPLGPNARDVSSSVPPDMRFGGPGDLISRSSSRQGHRERGPPPAFLNSYPYAGMAPGMRRSNSQSGARSRRPSFGMMPLAEVKSPIGVTLTTKPMSNRDTLTGTDIDDEVDGDVYAETSSSGDITPTATSGFQHEGAMRKRRTKLLRHEWNEAHYRLTGTQLTSHKNSRSLEMLECIDVDDYAVAVAANQSKMAAAMKRLRLNGKEKGEDVWKYGFQLTPAAEKRNVANGKTHHFAVRNANDRIDWMRELMLARAKKGKDATHERFE